MPSKRLLEGPFFEPLLRTLPIPKADWKTLSQKPSSKLLESNLENLFLEVCVLSQDPFDVHSTTSLSFRPLNMLRHIHFLWAGQDPHEIWITLVLEGRRSKLACPYIQK